MNLNLEDFSIDRTLGKTWDSNTDMLNFEVSNKTSSAGMTLFILLIKWSRRSDHYYSWNNTFTNIPWFDLAMRRRFLVCENCEFKSWRFIHRQNAKRDWDSKTDILNFEVSNKVCTRNKKRYFKINKLNFWPNGSQSFSDCENQVIDLRVIEKRFRLVH